MRTFALLQVPPWMKELLANTQPILIALQQKIAALTLQLQAAAAPAQPRGLGAMSSVIIDREIGDWIRFSNRRQVASYTGLCPGEYSSGNTRLQSCVTKHSNPRLRAALVELAWRLVRFQPNYQPIPKWEKVLRRGALATGAARKKAIVAVARQLAVEHTANAPAGTFFLLRSIQCLMISAATRASKRSCKRFSPRRTDRRHES